MVCTVAVVDAVSSAAHCSKVCKYHQKSIDSDPVPDGQGIQQELHWKEPLVLQMQSILEDRILKGKHRPVNVLKMQPAVGLLPF